MYDRVLRNRCVISIATALFVLLWVDSAFAQASKQQKPREITRTTKDGLQLTALYYASNVGKDAVPVILLHDWSSSGADFHKLATHLQSLGHAVLAPDLRGHGGSTSFRNGKKIHFKKMPLKLYHRMYSMDVETCKSFLIKENNEQRLNIEKLCVVGAGLGAVVAVNWAVIDWSWPRVGGIKQGQDVKALVLITPPWVKKTVSMNKVIQLPLIAKQLATYIVVGKQGAAAGDAKKIHNRMKAARRGTGRDHGLFYQTLPTKRQAMELLVPDNLANEIQNQIARFIDRMLVKKDLPWAKRKSPFD